LLGEGKRLIDATLKTNQEFEEEYVIECGQSVFCPSCTETDALLMMMV
jgi:hypothetical protein